MAREFTNHGNPLSVFFHDVFVFVCAVDSGSLLSLAEDFHAVFKIVSLTFIFLLNVGVLVNFLLVQIFDKDMQFFRNNLLQLHVVVDLLGNPVDGVFLVIDDDVVFADYSAESLDLVVHLLLINSETVDLETRLGIDSVEYS